MISSAGRAPPLQGGGRRFDPVITHHFGALAQLVEQLTFNQLVAGSNPARPTNVKRCPKGAFLLCTEFKDSNLQQVRVERSETTEPFTATARRASEASHPARPTNVKRRPKGAFLLCVEFNNSAILCLMRCSYQAYGLRRCRPDKTSVAIRHTSHRQCPNQFLQRRCCLLLVIHNI